MRYTNRHFIYFTYSRFFIRFSFSAENNTNYFGRSVDTVTLRHVTRVLTVRAVGRLSAPVIRRTCQVPRLRRVITSHHDAVLATTHGVVRTLRLECPHPATGRRRHFRTTYGCQHIASRHERLLLEAFHVWH